MLEEAPTIATSPIQSGVWREISIGSVILDSRGPYIDMCDLWAGVRGGREDLVGSWQSFGAALTSGLRPSCSSLGGPSGLGGR